VRPSALAASDAAASFNLPLALKHIVYFATQGLVAGDITSPFARAAGCKGDCANVSPSCKPVSPGLTPYPARVLFDF
jgi:hypothetical protein